MNLSGVWLLFQWVLVGSCRISNFLSDAFVCMVSRDTDDDLAALANQLIRRRLLPAVCGDCVSRKVLVSVAWKDLLVAYRDRPNTIFFLQTFEV